MGSFYNKILTFAGQLRGAVAAKADSAAIAPVCGGGTAWRASQLKKLPIWAFHGDCDTAVLPARSLEMVDAVTAAGGKPELTLFHNVGHNSWERAYRKTTCIDWLISQKRG